MLFKKQKHEYLTMTDVCGLFDYYFVTFHELGGLIWLVIHMNLLASLMSRSHYLPALSLDLLSSCVLILVYIIIVCFQPAVAPARRASCLAKAAMAAWSEPRRRPPARQQARHAAGSLAVRAAAVRPAPAEWAKVRPKLPSRVCRVLTSCYVQMAQLGSLHVVE